MKRIILIIFCAILSIAGMAQNTSVVKGMVMNADEEPLSGATVRVLGFSNSTVSSHDGKFEMTIPVHAKEIQASKDGYFESVAEIDGTYIIFKLKFDKKGAKNKAAESNARRDAELEARLIALENAKAHVEVKEKNVGKVSEAELEEKIRAEVEAKIRAEMEEEARLKAEMEAKIRAELEAKAEAELRTKLEAEARIKAEVAAKAKAEEEARLKAEAAARAKAEEEARLKAEAAAKAKAEEEARLKAEAAARAKAEEEARLKAEAAARAKAEEEARLKAEAAARAKAEEEARLKAEAAAKAKAEEEARLKAEAAARAKAEEEARLKAEVAAKAKAEEEARLKAEAAVVVKVEETAKVQVQDKQIQKSDEAVDLGLPSGLKWASCNIGASSPEERGEYFAWGEIDPKSNYTDFNSITRKKRMKQINSDANFDVATAKLGASWYIPTNADFEELINNCTWEWTTLNGVNGYMITGSNGNSIFLPATGYRDGASCNNDETSGEYWSSTPHKDAEYSYYLCYTGNSYYTFYNCRYVGRCVRPVKK